MAMGVDQRSEEMKAFDVCSSSSSEAKKERKRRLVKDGNNNREETMKRANRGEDDAEMEELWETIVGDENVDSEFPIATEQHDRREYLKKSGVGRVVMFLSKWEEEIASNRRLAKALVDKWSRPLFNQNIRYDDLRRHEEERIRYQRPPTMKMRLSNKCSGLTGPDDLDLDLKEPSSDRKSGRSKVRQPVIRPEATGMHFKIRPQSKINPDEIRARLKQTSQDLRRTKVNKKLQQLKSSNKRKVLQATRISVQGI